MFLVFPIVQKHQQGSILHLAQHHQCHILGHLALHLGLLALQWPDPNQPLLFIRILSGWKSWNVTSKLRLSSLVLRESKDQLRMIFTLRLDFLWRKLGQSFNHCHIRMTKIFREFGTRYSTPLWVSLRTSLLGTDQGRRWWRRWLFNWPISTQQCSENVKVCVAIFNSPPPCNVFKAQVKPKLSLIAKLRLDPAHVQAGWPQPYFNFHLPQYPSWWVAGSQLIGS